MQMLTPNLRHPFMVNRGLDCIVPNLTFTVKSFTKAFSQSDHESNLISLGGASGGTLQMTTGRGRGRGRWASNPEPDRKSVV